METITLFGVSRYEPDQLIDALHRWVRTDRATCTVLPAAPSPQQADQLHVTVIADDSDLPRAVESVVKFYASWRRSCRFEA